MLLENARKKTCPRKQDLYDIFCAILYLLKNAVTWRALPSDFPSPSTVRYYFDQWGKVSDETGTNLLAQALKSPVAQERVNNGSKPWTSFCIVDAQSVRNTDTARHKGYDAGKRVSGIKHHIAVDSEGLSHAIEVTTADVNDRKGALPMFVLNTEALSNVTQVLGDAGYTGAWFAQQVSNILGAGVQIARRNELHKFVAIPRRWVVERSFAWLEKCRRLRKNCERKLHTSLQFVVLAFIALLLRRY